MHHGTSNSHLQEGHPEPSQPGREHLRSAAQHQTLSLTASIKMQSGCGGGGGVKVGGWAHPVILISRGKTEEASRNLEEKRGAPVSRRPAAAVLPHAQLLRLRPGLVPPVPGVPSRVEKKEGALQHKLCPAIFGFISQAE
jgi:hypothetical protein